MTGGWITLYLIESRFRKFIAEYNCTSFSSLLRILQNDKSNKTREKIIDAITTNETLWFRDSSLWEALRDSILPLYAERKKSNPLAKFRVWSAACSTGQEPYSFAMLVDTFCQENEPLTSSCFEIMATDISPAALYIAISGRYDQLSMKRGFQGNWLTYKNRYFKSESNISILSNSIKSMIKFESLNLQNNFLAKGPLDIIFLRNVAIYFSTDFKRKLFERLARVLKPDGILLLGSAETPMNVTTLFTPERHGRATLFKLKEAR